jgi:hypothetical protein
MNRAMNFQVRLNAGKFLSSCTIVGSSRRARLYEVSYFLIFKEMGRSCGRHDREKENIQDVRRKETTTKIFT